MLKPVTVIEETGLSLIIGEANDKTTITIALLLFVSLLHRFIYMLGNPPRHKRDERVRRRFRFLPPPPPMREKETLLRHDPKGHQKMFIGQE